MKPVFATPVSPPGWDESEIPLIRIVDPAGSAIAWVAPDLAANCVGYAVRPTGGSGDEWTHVFHAIAPHRLTGCPEPYGCSILATLPHHQPQANGASQPPGAAHLHRWCLIERDPTAAVLETSIVPSMIDDERRAATGGLRLRLVTRLDDAALSLELTGENRDAEVLSVTIGLQPTFASGLLSREAVAVHTHSSGRPIRLEIPKNGRLPLTVSNLNRGTQASYSPTVYLGGASPGIRIALTLEAGVRHLVMSAVELPQVVSLALLSADPISLPPSGLIRLAASISVKKEEVACEPAESSPLYGHEMCEIRVRDSVADDGGCGISAMTLASLYPRR